jgi:hypothetical protein
MVASIPHYLMFTVRAPTISRWGVKSLTAGILLCNNSICHVPFSLWRCHVIHCQQLLQDFNKSIIFIYQEKVSYEAMVIALVVVSK